MLEDGICVLHVDDEPEFAALVSTFLERESDVLDVTTVTSSADGLDALDTRQFDCVVSDYEMPEGDGLEFLDAIRETDPQIPFILFTGAGSETIAGEAIARGVDAYVPKTPGTDVYRVLAKRIETLVEASRAETSYREVFQKAAVAMTVRDPETGAFIDVNQQYCDLMGYARAEILSFGPGDVGADESPYSGERELDLLREAVETGSLTVEWLNETKDGEKLYVEATASAAEIRGKTCVLVSVYDVTERKRRESELERTNDLLNRTQQLAQVGGWELDTGNETLRWTNEVHRIHGTSSEYEPTLEAALDFYHPADRADVSRAVERAVTALEPFDMEARLVTTDGETRWVRIRGSPQYDERGQILLRGTVAVITERKAHERRMRELQTRTRSLMCAGTTEEVARVAVETADEALGLSLSGVHLVDGETLVGVAVTPAVRDRFGETPGYERSDSEGAAAVVWDVFESGDTLVIEDTETHDAFVSEESPVRSGIIHPLGDHGVFITSSPEPNAFDDTEIALAEMLASTTTVALDRAEQQRRYDAVFNQTFQFTGLMKPDGTLLEANETALSFVGVDREAVIGAPLWETPWFQYDDETRQLARESVESARDGEFYRNELTVQGVDAEIQIDYSVRAVTDETGAVSLLVPEGRDITDLKEREAELERKNEQLEEFASVVSHDLRNPLGVAGGRLELAMAECDSEHLEHVSNAHDRMESLIRDLLGLARQGEPVDATEAVSLESLAHEAWATVETGEAVLRVRSSVDIEADRNRLAQLFENLFRNAVEHGSTEAGRPPAITVGALDDGVGFYVEDDGPGIPPEAREDVFEAGYTTSEKGSGFGLRIVERIASAHGWSVTATAGSDGGARFEIAGVDRANV